MLCRDENIWKSEEAKKVAFLVDAAAYFETLTECFEKAKHNIYILGWDIDSHVELLKPKSRNEKSITIGALIQKLLLEKPQLKVHILSWTYPIAYTPGREAPISIISGWHSHERFFIHFDNTHPVGACHHQKIVVIDDSVAFSGGIDICQRRWDTRNHMRNDPRRISSDGEAYPPFHDVQLMLEGEAAKALGELFRERWKRATDEVLENSERNNSIWPPKLLPDLQNIPAAISLTYPHFGGFKEERQIEKLTLAAIRSAKKLIYIENQFLTAKTIIQALKESLSQKEGPEIILVLTIKTCNLLEALGIKALQNRLMKRLKRADKYQRLGIFYPHVEGYKEGIIVHSKVMIVDDSFVKIGSSNLNNRSLGIDTECDVSLESDKKEIQTKIRAFREKLLCEHLGLNSEEFSRLAQQRSLVRTIYSRASYGRSLRPHSLKSPYYLRWISVLALALDPVAPLRREQILSDFLRTQKKKHKNKIQVVGLIFVICIMLLLAALWEWIPIFNLRSHFIHEINNLRIGTAFLALCSLTLMPPTLTLLITYTLLGPKLGFFLGWLFIIAISFFQYFVGIFLSQEKIKNLALWGSNTLGQQLVRLRALPDSILRLLPVAPLPVFSLMSGTLRMPLIGFFLITVFGALPLLISLGLLQLFLESVATYISPSATSLILLMSASLFLLFTRRVYK